MFGFNKKARFNLFDMSSLFNQNKNDYKSINSLEDTDNLLASRVINKISSSIISNGFNVSFDNTALNDSFIEFENKFNIKTKLLLAVRKSLTMKNGCLVYFVGGHIDKEITELEQINLIDTELVKIVEADKSNIFLKENNLINVIAKVSSGNKIIDNSRYSIIDIFPNNKTSFLQRILPFSDIIQGVMNKADRIFDLESSIIYKSTRHNQADNLSSSDIDAYRDRMIKIRDNMSSGRLALIPQLDDIINFTSSTSIAQLLPTLKDIFSSIVGIPKSIIFGEEKSGLNTGEGKKQDYENFMRDIKGYQELHIKPIIKKLISIFLKGKEQEYDIQFTETEPLAEKEKAEVNKLYNDSIVSLLSSGVISDDEARENVRGIGL